MNNEELVKEAESKIDVKSLVEEALTKTEKLLTDGFIKEAEVLIKQLLRVDDQNVPALQLHALICHKNREYTNAISILNKAIKIDENNAQTYNNISLCYLHNNQIEFAKTNIAKAIELEPLNCNFLCNYGLIQKASGDNVQAIETFQKALELNQTDSKIWESIGSSYGQEKEYDKAIFYFKKALEIDTNDLGAHVNLAYAYHLTGQWEKAWDEYEYRLDYWNSQGRNSGRFLQTYRREKKWDGKSDLTNKKFVIYCEQGFGDMIQFVRFVPELKKLGADVYIDTPEPLITLFSNFAKTRTIIDDNYDYNCSILSLPYFLNRKTPDKFMSSPYVHVDQKFDMTDYKSTFNVGICWAGSPGHPNDGNRSCHLSNFRELSKIKGVKLFSLQKEAGKRVYTSMPGVSIDLTNDCEDIKMVDMSVFMTDYIETAKIINSLDLVITVDTSLLHLAGAMGKKTYALIANNPDWRWTSEGNSTVWYENVELFRQENTHGIWTEVFNKVTEKVKNESILQNK